MIKNTEGKALTLNHSSSQNDKPQTKRKHDKKFSGRGVLGKVTSMNVQGSKGKEQQ